MFLHPTIFEFLNAINEKNSRKYFASIRPLYDQIRENLHEVADSCIAGVAKIDPEVGELKAKDCLFRIYRDARRVKEGDQIYKENFGFVIGPGGKKAGLPAYYLHIQAGNKSFFGGGVYRPTAQQIANLRAYLRIHGKEYKKYVATPSFKKYFGEVQGTTLTRPPKGYKPYDPFMELIMRKQHLMYAPLTDKQILNTDITQLFMEYVQASHKRIELLTEGCNYIKKS